MKAISAVVLGLTLCAAILTVWVPERWSVSLLEVGVLGLAAVWSGRMVFQPYRVRWAFGMIPLAGVVAVGLIQLMMGYTVERWETWNAVLRWVVYLAVFSLSLQIGSSPEVLVNFRRALLYFTFGLSIISVLQFFTSPGKVYWLFESGYKSEVLGPFVNRDHYAAFIELVFPIALFEAFTNRRRTVLCAAIAGTMFASVIAGASRAGSALLVFEAVVVLVLAARRGLVSGRNLRPALVAFLLFTGIFGSVVGWTTLLQRFKDPDPYGGRREMLQSAIAMVRARPWTGFGLGNFENAYPGYALFDYGFVLDHAHNDWAEWTTEGGVPLLALMAALGLWSIRQGVRSIWGIGIVSILLHSFVDYHLRKPAVAAWMFMILGAAAATRRKGDGERG